MIGGWLGGFWLWLALALISTLIGLPLGLWMLNRLPQVLTLKESGRRSARHGPTGRSFRHEHPVLFAIIIAIIVLLVLAALAS